jgi:uncharacterized protein
MPTQEQVIQEKAQQVDTVAAATGNVVVPFRHSVRLALILFAISQVLSAAVDCHNPKNRQQRVACATPELMDMDRQLSGLYEKVLATAPESRRKQLEYEQSSWEDSSGGCWDRADCIKKRYTDRIAAVEVLIAALPPTFVPSPTADEPHSPEDAQKAASDPTTQPDGLESNGSVQRQRSPDGTTPPVVAPPTQPQQRPDRASAVHVQYQTGRSSASDLAALATGLGLVFIGLVCVIYPMPAIIALFRRHRNRWVILAINLAFGATVIGWFIALVWALNKVDDPIKGGMKIGPQPTDPIL